MNLMRERLIELIESTRYWGSGTSEEIADHLLANGVIVPPCKVGQKVYQMILLKDKTGFIVERKVVGFHWGDFPKIRGKKRKQYFIVYHDATNSITHIDIDNLGKTVFLTKEEAEAALKGGAE